MDKLFLVELSGGNIRHCELELPATDYELLDALDKLRLSAADKLYFIMKTYLRQGAAELPAADFRAG